LNDKTKGTIFVLICIILWAMIPPAAKYGQTSLDNHQFLFFSSVISFVCLFATALWKKKLNHLQEYTKIQWMQVVILGLLGTYIYYLFLYLGYKEAKGLEVLVIQYTWPIVIVLLSLFLLKERLTRNKFFALLLGFSGVFLVLTKGEFSHIHLDNFYVISLVFLGASSFALFSVLSKKIHLEPISVTTVYFFSATVASFFSMEYFSTFAMPSVTEWFPILLNGVLLNGFSYLLWIHALKLADASYIAPFIFITPVLSAIYLIVLFDESMNIYYLIGLTFVIFSGILNSNIKFKKVKEIG
jgi:drug/metabolite transporter (DMT)-like permease